MGCCANLVVIDPTDHCVRFAHSSVKQYLEKDREGCIPAYPIGKKQGELECGEFCIAYLSFSNFSLQLEKQVHETATATVQNPAFLAGEALGSSFRHLFRTPRNQKQLTTLQFCKIRTASTPDQKQYKFLDYAITNWALHTKYITHKSSVWEKFERLATCFNETWNFHPWELDGRSPRSHLHSLFGWAVKGQHEPLLSIALSSKRDIIHICNIPLVGESLPALHVASNLGYYEMVKIILGICNVNLQDAEGYGALPCYITVTGKNNLGWTRFLCTKASTTAPESNQSSRGLAAYAQHGQDIYLGILYIYNIM
jgi:hypothetical protein